MTAKNEYISNCVGLTPDTSPICSTADSIARLSLATTNGVSMSPLGDSFNSRSIQSPHATSHIDTYDTENIHDSIGEGGERNGVDGSPEQVGGLCYRIRKQIEYYFSKENYWNDQYLLSQSDADQYVSLSTLANFPAVKHLSSDVEIIRIALRNSVQLEMDTSETKVRPNLKRCILILRDIPEDTSREEVESLFDGEGLPDVKGRVEYAINSNWYVRFDSEAEAYTAYQFIINRTFQGRPLYPRIKSESSSAHNTSPELPTPYSPRPQFEQFSMYNYPAIPLPYMPPPVPSWGPIEPILYPGYLKPTLLVHRFLHMPRMLAPKNEFILAPMPRNGAVEYTQTSPTNSRHHTTVSTTETQGREIMGDRGPRRKPGGRYPSREDKRTERVPTPKMDADSFPPLPTSPGNNSAPWGTHSPQTPVEPTSKTLSDIVRKGPVGVSSPQQRHTAANPPPSIGRGRGRGMLPETPIEEVGERRKETELEPYQKNMEVTRTMGRGRKPKSQSTSDSPTQISHTTDQSRSRSESGEKEILKSEKLSYAQMAQKLPPPPPPPLPEAANYMPPSPTLSDSPNTPSHSSQHMGFFKETSDSISNGCRGSQDTDTSKYSQRKPFVRVSNGPINRSVRGYNGPDNSKLRKGVYSNTRTSRDRRHIPQDRDNTFKDH